MLALLGAAAALIALRPRETANKPETKGPDASIEVHVTAADKPIALARVSVSGRCEAQTDAAGVAVLTACPLGKRRVLVEAAGFARAAESVVLRAGDNTLQVALAPGWRLQGRVRDDDGNAVADALVTIARDTSGDPAPRDARLESWTVHADDDGTFECDTLPSGAFSVQAARAPYEPVTVPVVAVPATAPLDIVLQRMAAIRGRVLAPENPSLAGATVSLAGSGVWPPRILRTAAGGEFHFPAVPPGVYELRAEHRELISAPLEGVAIDSGQEVAVELALNPGVVLTGTVTEAASGRALAGAQVRVHEDALTASSKDARSAKNGGFEVRGLRPLPHRISVELPGYVSLETIWLPQTGAVLPLSLLRSARVRGRVQDAQGEPVADAELEVLGRIVTGDALRITGVTRLNGSPRAADGAAIRLGVPAAGDNLGVMPGVIPPIPMSPRPPGAEFSPSGVYRSDASGMFELDGIPPGEFRVWARRGGFVPGASRGFQLGPAAVREGLVVVLTRGGAIHGRVLDTRKAPVSQVRVTLSAGGEPLRATVSDEAGEFEFRAVQGRYRVSALPLGAPSAQYDGELKDDRTQRVELVLETTTDRLDGRVVDSRGFPISHARIKLETKRPRASLSTTVLSKQDGTFEFSGLPPPPYTLHADHPEFASGADVVVDDTARPLSLTLETGSALAGYVLDKTTRDPLPGALVTLTRDTSGPAAKAGAAPQGQQTRSDNDGQFEFSHVADGSYQLAVDAQGHVAERRQISLRAQRHDRPAPEEEFQLQASGSVSGSVVDRIGAPIWNAEVFAGVSNEWSHSVRTDHAGRFVVRGLAPGAVRLLARKDSLRAVAAARVHEGVDTPGAILRFEDVAPAEQEPDSPAPPADSRSADGPASDEAPGQLPAEPEEIDPDEDSDTPAGSVPQGSAMGAVSPREDSIAATPPTPLALGRRGDLVIVERVDPGSRADALGLRNGDVVTAINGEHVRSPAQARGMLGLASGPHGWVIDVRREGQLLRLRQSPHGQ